MTNSWLRIIQVNDVYELDALPSLATAVRTLKQATQHTLVIVAGDFLSPSLLSSLDHGAAMVDCLNAVGVTHVCLGNHEADVSQTALYQRMKESTFQWVNSNVHDLFSNDEGCEDLTVPYDILETSFGKRIAILGLLTDDPGLYRPGAFGDADIEPIVKATERLLPELKADFILPMTHQAMQDDRDFATTFAHQFPVICGGHDHTPYDKVVSGCRILKAGMDATQTLVIDIKWPDAEDSKPSVTAELLDTDSFEPDNAVQQRVRDHEKILEELDRASLFRLSKWVPEQTLFSTHQNRVSATSTGTTALCTMLRMGLRAQCAIVNAGAVRGNRVYDDQTYFTWSDMKAEMPFTTAMTPVYLPGSVLEQTLVESRNQKKGTGGYLHPCNNIALNDDSTIKSIRGEPFEPARKYLTGVPSQLFEGIDDHRPLLQYAENESELDAHLLEETAVPAKMLIVQVFSSLLWLNMGSFENLDYNRDGVITRDEIQRQVDSLYGHATGKLVLDNIMSVADLTGDGTISPLEMMIVKFAATDLLEHACSNSELRVMREVSQEVLGVDATEDQVHDMVAKIKETLDLTGDGTIHRHEVMQAMGSLQYSDLLQ